MNDGRFFGLINEIPKDLFGILAIAGYRDTHRGLCKQMIDYSVMPAKEHNGLNAFCEVRGIFVASKPGRENKVLVLIRAVFTNLDCFQVASFVVAVLMYRYVGTV